ncbi:hypothetical protein TNCV_2374621 [Trichonephila clavipes]|nr:hypothetical protein TNCV_2374621 [Trichonephila clavipes]
MQNDEVRLEYTVQSPQLSYNEGLKAVEAILQYFEQQGASVMNSLFLRRLRDEAVKRKMHYGKQQNIKHFYKKNNQF